MLLKFFHDFILISSISTCICSLTASSPLLNIATTSLASLLLFFVFYADIVTSTITHRHFPLLRHRHFHHHALSLHINIVTSHFFDIVTSIITHRHFTTHCYFLNIASDNDYNSFQTSNFKNSNDKV